MDSVIKTIDENKLLKKGDKLGVGVSGGSDSMALLHFFNNFKKKWNVEIIAINIDHSIREHSADDSSFVMKYCEENDIKAYTIKIDVPKLSKENGTSIEMAARDARYGVFSSLISKGIVDKVATAHHISDQAETVLLNMFRGCGLSGLKGIEVSRDKIIRPMLATSKKEINKYISTNEIPYVIDESNFDDVYQRNYIRNNIIPLIEKRWPAFAQNVNTLSKSCSEDENYIESQVINESFIVEGKTVRVPLSSFLFHSAVVSRTIFKALRIIGVKKDIERKHIQMIKDLAKKGQNGNRITLPVNVSVYKEYDYITLTNKEKERKTGSWLFKCGSFQVPGFGTVITKTAKDFSTYSSSEKFHIIDGNKLPKDAKWRYRREGDVIVKLGGGTKQLKSYLIEKKIPQRLRDDVPVLAYGNEIFIVAGVGISEDIKIDDTTKKAYLISYIK